MTRVQIEALIAELREMIDRVVTAADEQDKADAYAGLRLRLTYHLNDKAVLVEARPDTAMCLRLVSEGGLEPFAYLLARCGDPWLGLAVPGSQQMP